MSTTLLIDIGNTRFKWATADDGRLQGPPSSEPHQGDPATLFYTLALPQVDRVWVSHVTGAAHEEKLRKVIESHYGFAPEFARTQADCRGLHVAYAEPGRLGVDRWLAMLALWTETGRAFCVVNAGTALTFDAVDDSGQHAGGLIAPGLVTAERAVLDATRFAASSGDARSAAGAQAVRYGSGLGRDTESCVRQGALHACVGLIERASRQSHGGRFISGGDAATLLPHIGGARTPAGGPGWDWRPNLVLEGLLKLAQIKTNPASLGAGGAGADV